MAVGVPLEPSEIISKELADFRKEKGERRRCQQEAKRCLWDGDDEINPKSVGIWGGDDEIKARGSHQLGEFPISNFNNRFDVGESRLAKIKAKISVEDFDYLKGFANSNKRIDEGDPHLVKIRAKISEEDADYLKELANKRFGVNNTGFAKMHGRTANSFRPQFFDNNV
ncbi:Hypothetical predicted protein, partial [Prunus dulcis]